MRAVCSGHVVSRGFRDTDTPYEIVSWLKEVADERNR